MLGEQEREVVIRTTNMDSNMQKYVTEVATEAAKFSRDNLIADEIRKNLNQEYGWAWHCIMSKESMTAECSNSQYFMKFSVKGREVYLFKTG